MASFNSLENNDLIFQTSGKQKISVYHTKNCDGGGRSFGQQFVHVINNRYPGRTFNHCLDWCSGPGFIGFDLFDHNICKELHLVDHYQPAIICAERTKQQLPTDDRDRIHTYQINDLASLPCTCAFDLVVANPPHFPKQMSTKMQSLNKLHWDSMTINQRKNLLQNFMPVDSDHMHRITVDQNWKAHENFYKHIKSHLTTDGVILMQENAAGSSVKDFESMIALAGLTITDVFFDKIYRNFIPSIKIYYIEIKHTNL